MLKLRSLEFLDAFGEEFWIDDRLDGVAHAQVIRYLSDYMAEGRGWLRETAYSLDQFRQAAGGPLSYVDDDGILDVLSYAVQRIRNCAHILQMGLSSTIDLVRIVAVIDERTSPICRLLDGKFIRLQAAIRAIPVVVSQPREVCLADARVAFGANDWLNDAFVIGGAIPPFHRRCQTRIEGVVPGAGLPKSGSEQARRD